MNVFYITLAVTFFLALLIKLTREKNIIYSKIIMGIMIIILIVVGGTQINIGDTPVYMNIFKSLVINPSNVDFDYDGGFIYFMLFLTHISSNPQVLIIVCAIIINLINVKMFFKYESLIELQIFLYIASGYYIVTMNGLRQCIVAAIFLWATKYIVNGNLIKYLIVVFLVSFLHQSALVMILVYFIARCKPWSKMIYVLIIISLIGVMLFDKLVPMLFTFLQNSNYSHYESYISVAGGGSNKIRIFIAAVPVILSYIKRNELNRKWPQSDVFVNISLLNMIFYIFSTFNWIFARFNIYFQLYIFILLPYLIKECFNKKERRILYFACIVCYFIVFWFEYDRNMNLQYIWRYNLNDIFYNSLGW